MRLHWSALKTRQDGHWENRLLKMSDSKIESDISPSQLILLPMSDKLQVFVSSVQKELAVERKALKQYIHGDALLCRFFDVFLFEDLPASDRRADNVYLDQVDRCSIYLGLFGSEYGFEDAAGVSPTEREFDRATAQGKTRLIYIKGQDDKNRHPKMLALVRTAGGQLIRRRFENLAELNVAVYSSLVDYLEARGSLLTLPFDRMPGRGASPIDISPEKLARFVSTARRERNFPLADTTPIPQALAHLDLLEHDIPTHAALLLFGKNPQHYVPSAETKCAHFHGTEIRKPIPSYQVYRGTVFEQVDQAVDFVMANLARTVTPQVGTPASQVHYDLPYKAVREAIVNAVAHRDYASNAAVQVMLFADRLEVWNPGDLPAGLTPEKLRGPHTSIPRNPLVAEPLFWVRYIEKLGTGTLDMIALCREAGLPEPEFRQEGGEWVVTLWRDWLTDKVLAELQLNDRQKQAVVFLKTHLRIGNSEYQTLVGAAKRTAHRDLIELTRKGVLQRIGKTGKGTYYVLRKGATKGPKGPPQNSGPPKGSQRGQRGRGPKPSGSHDKQDKRRKPAVSRVTRKRPKQK
jgi:predicted HTH transcriptional regulator